MSATPSMLLRAYNASNDVDSDAAADAADAEDVLMELLYTLAQMPDCAAPASVASGGEESLESSLGRRNKHTRTLRWVARYLYGDPKNFDNWMNDEHGNNKKDHEDGVDRSEWTGDSEMAVESSDHVQREWTSGLILLRKISGVDSNVDVADVVIPPHLLLRYIIDSAMEYQRQRSNLSESESGTDTNVTTGMTIHTIVHLLLASIALQLLTRIAPTKQRWRRVQSMCMESIVLFQSLAQQVELFHAKDIIIVSVIFCEYLSPPIHSLLQMMEHAKEFSLSQSKSRPKRYLTNCILAAMVQIASNLSFYIMEHDPVMMVPSGDSNAGDDPCVSDGKSLVMDLTCAILSSSRQQSRSVSLRHDFVLTHPLRQYYEERKSPVELSICDNHDDEDDHDHDDDHGNSIVEHMEECILRNLSPLLCKELDDITSPSLDFDSLCGMKIMWHADGMAIMAHAVIEQRISSSKSFRSLLPEVYSPAMLFAMFFPHATTLLNLSQRDEQEQIDETDEGSGNGGIMNPTAVRYFDMGMLVLDFLLERVGPHGMKYNVIYCANDGDQDSLEIGPLAPSGIIQLLLNALVNISMTAGSTVLYDTPMSQVSKYMSREKILQSVRQLLSIYQNHVQLSVIARLIKTSPFPFLVPFLLDLTRNLITNTSASGAFHEIKETMDIIEPFVLDMTFSLNIQEENTSVMISEINKLLENVETYCSIVSLVRLLVLATSPSASLHGDVDALNKVLYHLDDINSGIQSLLQRWDIKGIAHEDRPNNFFRLYLLEIAMNDLQAARKAVDIK